MTGGVCVIEIAQWIVANWSTLAILATLICGLWGIFKAMSKLTGMLKRQQEALEYQKEYNSIIMECVLVLLCAAKGEKLNGNVTAALKRLNDFMVKESSNN